jgi:hypothetical protein
MWKRLVPAILLIWFLAQTIRALADHSYLGFFMIANANSATQLMMLDLVLALGLFSVWMVVDARKRGGSYLPFLAVTLLFGVAGPLLYLATRGWGRGRERVVALALLALLTGAAALFWGYADLRTPAVEQASVESAQRGRELLERAAERHGLAAWERHTTLETTATDIWTQGGWWPAPVQRFRSQALLGTFTSRVELLDGPGAGEIRGIQSWAPYRRRPPETDASFLQEPAPEITFYLPTLHYFAELPFRLLSAETVLDAGSRFHRGRLYDRVFVTWGPAEPHAAHDQYLLWIERESGLIAMAHYTVRDLATMNRGAVRSMMKAVGAGTIHFDDYRRTDGVMIPFAQTVTLPEPALTQYPVREHFLHRLEIDDARFDTVARELLVPSPALATPSDRKPDPGDPARAPQPDQSSSRGQQKRPQSAVAA